MKRRTLIAGTLVLAIFLSISPLYVTPASGCVTPDVKIWKEFLDTSDPPPYNLETEYHWDIELGVWTSVNLRSARVYDNFGAELKIDNITTPEETYTFTYPDYEEKYPTEEATVVINGEGPYELNWRGATFGERPYRFRVYWVGKTHKVRFRWYIGGVEADENLTITIGVSTDLNPGGKQQYTSPCEHCINSGAVLRARWRWKSGCWWRWLCAKTEELCIKVECGPPPTRLIVDKFNDLDGEGDFDVGEPLITDWTIYVTYPNGTRKSYLTPVNLEITDIGTYTIEEDLTGDWVQTALRVDDDYKTPTISWTMTINEGETHDILYGNWVPPPPTARLIIEKFNDTDSDGVFNGDDVMMTGWEIYVTDPHGVTKTHSTRVDLEITEFGTYTIREDLPEGWEQTALFVDGIAMAPSLEVTIDINPGDERSVLYGNHKIPPPPPRIRIYLGIRPLGDIPVGRYVTFRWRIVEVPPGVTVPQKVTLTLTKDGGAPVILYEGFGFPDDFTGKVVWHADEAGDYEVKVRYDYLYLGKPYYASATHGFTVIP